MNSIIPNSLSVPITIPRLSIPFVHKISISASFSLNQIADFTWKLSELLKCCDQCVQNNSYYPKGLGTILNRLLHNQRPLNLQICVSHLLDYCRKILLPM